MKYNVNQAQPLLEFLIQHSTKKRNDLKNALKFKSVEVNGEIITKHDYMLNVGDEVTLGEKKSNNDLDILYEDDEFIVINKPCGLLTERTARESNKTAFNYVNTYLKKKRQQAYLVHRLDQYTSGVLMFVKRKDIYDMMTRNWNNLVKTRRYIAIVEGDVKPKSNTIDTYLYESKSQLVKVSKNQGKRAITHYKVMKTNHKYTMLDIHLDTGRKNQIRVHLNHIGYPLIGDDKYGHASNPIKRLGLHGYQVEFTHPKTKRIMSVCAPIPEVMNTLIKD